MEEVLLHNPFSHLVHQRLGDIRYTMGGQDNIEIAKSYYAQAIKLNGNNLRALYGLYLVSYRKNVENFILLLVFTVLRTSFKLQSAHQQTKRSSKARQLGSF